MQNPCTNIYKAARLRAGYTQEQAAEVLALSVESIKAYETGVRTPPDQTVRLMVRKYDAPDLALEHARETDELGIVPKAATPQPIPLAALALHNRMLRFAEERRDQQLLQIAEDGVIDEAERPVLDEIVDELEGICSAYLAIRCAGKKKERHEQAGSRRSRDSRTQGRDQLSDEQYSTSARNCKEMIRNTAKHSARKAVIA